MNNLRFVRRKVDEPFGEIINNIQSYRTVIKLILQERHMDNTTEIWEDVPIEDEK